MTTTVKNQKILYTFCDTHLILCIGPSDLSSMRVEIDKIEYTEKADPTEADYEKVGKEVCAMLQAGMIRRTPWGWETAVNAQLPIPARFEPVWPEESRSQTA